MKFVKPFASCSDVNLNEGLSPDFVVCGGIVRKTKPSFSGAQILGVQVCRAALRIRRAPTRSVCETGGSDFVAGRAAHVERLGCSSTQAQIGSELLEVPSDRCGIRGS